MSAAEVVSRAKQHALKTAWALPALRPKAPAPLPGRRLRAARPPGTLDHVPEEARAHVLGAADQVMAGRWLVLGHLREDMVSPDWGLDPLSGRRAPLAAYCFSIDHRDASVTGNVKQVWELSRLQHLSVLCLAYALSGDERYAERVAAHLRSWWRANPWLAGTNWTSGIEVGIRLISLAWTRRLLNSWTGAPGLFEHDGDALGQIWAHQRYLAAFPSTGSSANNHAVAEAAGLLVGALAFPWWPESEPWARRAAGWLEAELARNSFPSGTNREMAFEYHGLVAELALVAGAEADAAGHPLSDATWELVARMCDVVAATADASLAPPRYGDGDDGKALVLDPSASRWEALLDTGRALVGSPEWWPPTRPGATSYLLAALAAKHPAHDRPLRRPHHFADAGLTILRGRTDDGAEVWCRCDSGPHGFLSIAAHGHADALSVEVRHAGVEILADPGTYCYHDEPEWRAYFRSTLGHNTLEVGGRDQSVAAGPFLWSAQANTKLISVEMTQDGEATSWSAEHDGYASLQPGATHRRSVKLLNGAGRDGAVTGIEVRDEVRGAITSTGTAAGAGAGEHPLRLAFHFGPALEATLEGHRVHLGWDGPAGSRAATLVLPESLEWRLAKGETNPVLGWYSPSFGIKTPAWSAVGEGTGARGTQLLTELRFKSAEA